jgi:hypothetical protein
MKRSTPHPLFISRQRGASSLPKVIPKKEMSETQNLNCPFCENGFVMAKPGKTCCSVCETEFEIDDRLECVFADPDNVRLPLRGIVCSACGLVQSVTLG